MKYYLAIDSGGTKAAAILYNEDFKRVAVCVTGSVRPNSTGAALVKKHTEDIINRLELKGKTIEEYGGTCEQSVIDAIKSVCTVKGRGIFGELDMGLSAAGIFGDGLLALCGTGATVFSRVGGKKLAAGGYGFAVSDEGSGYYVGRQAILAAIRDREGRGERTSLTDLIPRHLGFSGREELRDAIFSFYANEDVSPVTCVARCAPVAVKAAEEGDETAVSILKEAGRLLAEQMCYLIRENGLPDGLPAALSGSMWRGNPVLFNEFKKVLTEKCGKRKIVIPRIEPVLGVLAKRIYDEKGSLDDGDISELLTEFPEFEYGTEAKKCCLKDTERR